MAREEKRTEILRAAARVFFVNGFEGTRIEDVAKEAGIGKGTVYEYFESKQQLFDEMVSYNRERHLKNIKEALEKGRTFREKFIELARYQTNFLKEHNSVFNLIARSKMMAREVGALMMEHNIRMEEIIKKVLEEAILRKELRPDLNTDIAAGMVIGTINQYCNKRVVFLNVDPGEIDYEKVADTLLRGIGNHP